MGKECFSHVEFKVSTISYKHKYSQVSNSKFQVQDVAFEFKGFGQWKLWKQNTSFETTSRMEGIFFTSENGLD